MAVTSVTVERGAKQMQGVFTDMWVVTGVVDAASLADAAGETHDCTIPGVALGDMVLSFSLGVSLAGITATAYVKAADTISIRLQNESGGTLDLASTAVKAVVVRPSF